MCFEIMGTGAMLLGDYVLFDITPNITDWAGVEDSLGDYLDSLQKMEFCQVSIPLPGHRKAGCFKELIWSLTLHHRKRLEECRTVIRSLGHARLYDITGNGTAFRAIPAPIRLRLFLLKTDGTFYGLCQGPVEPPGP